MSNKDAYYFSHDSNAKDDPKCSMLIEQLGLEGYGIFWVLVETLRDQPEFKYPLNMISIIARKYNTTSEKVRVVIGNYGLFVVDEDCFFSLSLTRRMEALENKREQNRLKGIKSGEARRLPAASKTESQLNSNSTVVEPQLNSGSTVVEQVKESKVKESKVSKVKKYDYFSDFWSEYPKKEAKQETIRVFDGLKVDDELMEKIMSGLYRALERWKKDEMKFVPQAPRWLRGRRWEDGF